MTNFEYVFVIVMFFILRPSFETWGTFKVKFIYFEKVTKFCEISTVDLTVTT